MPNVTNNTAEKHPVDFSLNFSSLLQQAPVAVAVLAGPHGALVFANDLFLSLTGRSREQLLHKPANDILPFTSADFRKFVDSLAFGTGTFTLAEQQCIVNRGGRPETIWLDLVCQPLASSDLASQQVMIIATDVTAQVLARFRREEEETLLRKTKSQLELSINIGHIGIWHWDVKADVLTWSNEQFAIYGVSKENFSGRIRDFHRMVVPEDLPLITSTGSRERQNKGDFDYRFRIRRTDGAIRWIQGRSRSFYNEQGEIEYRTGVNIDVTNEKEALDRLQESEERFRSTFDNAAVGIAHVAPDGTWLQVNERLCKILGYSRTELLSSAFQNITHPDDLDVDMKLVQEVLNGQRETYDLEKRYLRRDGSVVWANLTVSLVRAANGAPKYFISVMEDISPRKHVEMRLQLAQDIGRAGFFEWELATGRAFVTGILQHITSADPQTGEVDINQWIKNVHPNDNAQVIGLLRNAFSRKKAALSYEFRVQFEGREIWLGAEVQIKYNAEGRAERVVGMNYDISERKAAEFHMLESEVRYRRLAESLEKQVAERTQELAQSQAFLQSVLDTTQNGIATYEPIRNRDGRVVDFRIAYINHMVTKDIGLLPAEITGRTIREVFPNAFKDGSFEHLVRYVETGEGSHYEMTHPAGDELIYLDVSLARMGEGATVTVRNITGQRKAALQLEELNRQLQATNLELQRSNEDLQQFAHVASHDLKEPIRKVRTFGSRLEEEFGDLLPERGQLYLTKMLSSAERMFGLIDGVLNYSIVNSLESGFEKTDLNDILSNIEADLEVLLQQSGGQLKKQSLPSVNGSPVLLNQLFYNLLNNALKFSRAGVPPVINLDSKKMLGSDFEWVLPADADKIFIQISVCDNGIGFKPEHAERIFKTFTRLNSRDKFEGTGLGLALCKKIVERHHGYIYATGKENEGACFYVLLPH